MSEVTTTKPEFIQSGPVPTNIAEGGYHIVKTVRATNSEIAIDLLDDGTYLIHCRTHGNWTIEKIRDEAWKRSVAPQEWCGDCYDAKAEKDAVRAEKSAAKAESSVAPLKRALAKATDPAVIAGLEMALANANPKPRQRTGERGEDVNSRPVVVVTRSDEAPAPAEETREERKRRLDRERKAAKRAAQKAQSA